MALADGEVAFLACLLENHRLPSSLDEGGRHGGVANIGCSRHRTVGVVCGMILPKIGCVFIVIGTFMELYWYHMCRNLRFSHRAKWHFMSDGRSSY